jgi:diguanylate cyclase (GGDEF)-like protein
VQRLDVAGARPRVPTADAAERRAARLSYAALAVGLVLVAVFVALRDTGANPVLYLVSASYGTGLSIVGAVRMPRARRHIWVAFAVAQALFLVADGIWTVWDNVLHLATSPSLADVGYLAQYPAFALGLWWLVRARRQGRERAPLLDAAILATGMAVAGLVLLVGPSFETTDVSLAGQLVSAGYPLGDLMVLSVALRLLAGGSARNLALWALLASVAALLAADLAYGSSLSLGIPYPDWIDGVYLVAYALLGFAALHPSAHRLSDPVQVRVDGITALRLSWLGAALVLAPLTGVVAHAKGLDDHPWIVFVACAVAAVLVVLRLWDLVKDLQLKAAQLAALADRDGLTGVANRRAWDQELLRACTFAKEHDAPLTVAVLDLDHFKEFNDTHGHLAGDRVLRETASAWAAILEGRGFLARYGGEEFTVLLPHTKACEAQSLLERLRQAVTHRQTCSIGVASWDQREAPAELMARADRALYRAKRSGRDRVAIHEEGRVTVMRPLSAENSVLASLRTVYQPVLDLRTGTVAGVEALSRFDGLDPRAVFDKAEHDGTGPALEAGAIASALRDWDGEGLLAVNVSLSSLVTPAVQEVLSGDLSSVVLEITEVDDVDYGPDVMYAVQEVRARGALVAIDDFGAGFSNLRRVAKIRPDVVKIDMSLIRDIHADPTLQALVSACVRYAELTATRMIAEGIETQEELDCLIGLGVELGQGYLLGRPGPLAEARRVEWAADAGRVDTAGSR